MRTETFFRSSSKRLSVHICFVQGASSPTANILRSPNHFASPIHSMLRAHHPVRWWRCSFFFGGEVLREYNIIALLFQQKICSQYNSVGFKSVRFIFGCRGAVVVVVVFVIFLGHFSRRIYACNYQEVEAVLLCLVLFVGEMFAEVFLAFRRAPIARHTTACALPAVAMRPFWQRICNISILPCLWLCVGATVTTPHTAVSLCLS